MKKIVSFLCSVVFLFSTLVVFANDGAPNKTNNPYISAGTFATVPGDINNANGMSIYYSNYEKVSAETLHTMAKIKAQFTSNPNKLELVYRSTKPNPADDSREREMGSLTVYPMSATNIDFDIYLSVYVEDEFIKDTKSNFETWFDNKIHVISLAHQGSFGMPVKVSARISLSNLNLSSLYLYSYNKTDNTYNSLRVTDFSYKPSTVLSSPFGATYADYFVTFTTTVGGDIIITDAPLKKTV